MPGAYVIDEIRPTASRAIDRPFDPVMRPFKVAARLGQAIGFAGPPDAKAQEGLSKYIITDMYAKAVQGMPPEDAVKWAEGELKKIYV